MAIDNNRTAIIRSHKNSYAKNHNQYSEAFLTSVLGNEPDVIEGQDSGELTKPKVISPYVNDEIERIQDSIINNYQIIF